MQHSGENFFAESAQIWKNRMRVLQISNDYLNTKLYVSLFNSLSDKGVDNVVFVPVNTAGRYHKENDRERKDGSLVIAPCFSNIDRLLFYSKQRKLLCGIECGVDISDIDVVHAHTLFSAGYAAMTLKKKYGIPFVVAVRNVDVNVFFKRMRHLRSIGVDIMREASKIIFLSPAYRTFVLENYVDSRESDMFAGKSEVVPNGISDIFLKNKGSIKSLSAGEVRIIQAGEINRNKNLELTVNAARMLTDEGLNVSITAVGDVTERSCRHLLDDDRVFHVPKLSQQKLLDYYRGSDIFVMPSHRESFGLVYAEAMSQGLPVIYTKGQGFDGHFEEGEVGFSVTGCDPAELAGRIKDICADYTVFSGKAIKGADRFDWEKIAVRYKAMYQWCEDYAH